MGKLRLGGSVVGRQGMKIEIVFTNTKAGFVVEKVVAQDKVTDRTNIKDLLIWYAARLLKGGFDLHRDDDSVFGWAAIDSRGNKLTIGQSQRPKEDLDLIEIDDIQDWKQKVTLVPDEELTELHETGCLGLCKSHDPKWSVYLSIVEEEIQRRGATNVTLTDDICRVQMTELD